MMLRLVQIGRPEAPVLRARWEAASTSGAARPCVMAGRGPATHVFSCCQQRGSGRPASAGHDTGSAIRPQLMRLLPRRPLVQIGRSDALVRSAPIRNARGRGVPPVRLPSSPRPSPRPRPWRGLSGAASSRMARAPGAQAGLSGNEPAMMAAWRAAYGQPA
jgi:hypothetical protein